MADYSGKRFIVSGKVQGVWFRASTAKTAKRLGISGSAINLPDGRVEVVAFGTAEDIQTLAGWLAKGPPLAKVHDIETESIDAAAAPADGAFRIG